MANSGAGRRRKAEARSGDAGEQAASRAESRRARARAAKGARGPNPSTSETLASSILDLSKLYGEKGGGTGSFTDVLSQTLLLILGSGPAIAANEGLMAAQQSNGVMFYQAVANQQALNLLGMCTTAKCVRYMFDSHPEEIVDVDNFIDETTDE